MELWQWLRQRRVAAMGGGTTTPLSRDPDLDAMHQEQHDLIHRTGYARARILDSFNERLRESWKERP